MTGEPLKYNRLIIFVVSALAYYVAGLIGLELAIPPGFASAVWPASGVALALIILLSSKYVIAGTFTASFALNLQLVFDVHGSLTWLNIVVPLFIALGAALQLAAGYVLFRFFLGKKIITDVARNIILFSLVVVPFSCLVSASIGTAALATNNVISQDAIVFSWFTWWLGDSIGILLFTPMLIVMFAKKSHFKFSRRLQVVIPTAVIFTCVCVLFFWSIDNSNKNMERGFDVKAKRYTQNIEERLNISSSKVKSYQAFFQGSDYISYKEFVTYSQALLGDESALHAVGWTEVTLDSEREISVKSLRDQGYKDFDFKAPSSMGMVKVKKKKVYYPILYIYPYKSNKRALGLDLSELPGRLELLKKIAVTGKGRVTPPITLVQEKADEKSIIIYLPVWQKYPKDEVLRGYVSGVYRASGILGGVLNDAEKNNIGISITDITDEFKPKKLIERKVDLHPYIKSKTYDIEFQGSKYRVKFSPSSGYEGNKSDWVSWVILIFGFLISALLQAFILMMSGAIEHTNEVVKMRTKQLTKAIEKAESASKAKSMFLANMNHELRTPLNAIVGLVNLCLKTTLTDKQAEYLYQAKLATHTLMSLINQSLDYAKIESGKLELENLEFDLSAIIKKIYAVFNMQALQKNIEFNLHIDGELSRYFLGDALRVEQVLLNICSNAIKFTDQGSVSLSLASKALADHTQQITIKIKDSGIGISKEQQASLFQSFQQADNTTTRKYGGTGLGLAISKQLVELMNGSIEINSEIGSGCEFVITIPLKASNQTIMFNHSTITSHEHELEKTERESNKENSLAAVNVLLVEDIEINRMIATELLENHGANVTQAFDGQQALDALQTGAHFDVVLMDIQMPVMDGLEATRAIRLMPEFEYLPVLAMTANAMNEDIANCQEAGMNGHIPKPIDESNMLSTILAALHPSDS
jgi:signal transduction histidine kinase/sensor domain CHASE-containing protein/ActR/RegA family two-component response regulator